MAGRAPAVNERVHEFKDPDGCTVRIKPSADHPDAAYLDSYGDGIAVPAHRLFAEFVPALCRACGVPVPDLPVIYDPAAVEELATDLHDAICAGVDGSLGDPSEGDRLHARRLLDAGWRKP